MEKVTGDGGVRKRIVTLGNGEGAVGSGASVSLRYSLSVVGAGVHFDSSESRRDGVLKFTLGKGKALRGLEALAESMEVGEVCEAELDSSWAYGDKGLARYGVKGGATIAVSLTMVEGKGVAKAKRIAEMSSRERFDEAAACKERGNSFFKEAKMNRAADEYQRCLRFIEYVFYKPRARAVSDDDSSLTGEGDIEQKGGEGDVESEVEKVEEKVENHKAKDELASEEDGLDGPTEETTEKGRDERKDGSRVEGREGEEEGVEEVDISTPELTPGTVINADINSAGLGGDVSGNEQDRVGEESGRDNGFVEAEVEPEVEEAVEEPENNDPNETEVRDLHVVCLNNMALCLLKRGENKKVVELATLSMQMEPSNHKPFFYRGRARHALGDWDESKKDLIAAAKLAPKSMGIRVELDKLNKKIRLHKEQERKAAAAMFG